MKIEVFKDEKLPYGGALILRDCPGFDEDLICVPHFADANYRRETAFRNRMRRIWHGKILKQTTPVYIYKADEGMLKELKTWWKQNSGKYRSFPKLSARTAFVTVQTFRDNVEPYLEIEEDFEYLRDLHAFLSPAPSSPPRKRPREKLQESGISIRNAASLPRDFPPTCCEWGIERESFSFAPGTCGSGFQGGGTFEVTLHGKTVVMCYCQMHQLIPHLKPGFKRGNLVDFTQRSGQVRVRGVLDAIVLADGADIEAYVYMAATNKHIAVPFDQLEHADCRPRFTFDSGDVVYAPYKSAQMHPYSMKRVKATVIDRQQIANDPSTQYYRVCVDQTLLTVPSEYLERVE